MADSTSKLKHINNTVYTQANKVTLRLGKLLCYKTLTIFRFCITHKDVTLS